MLPTTLALIDDDPAFADFLADHLRQQGIEVTVFDDSNDLLTSERAYSFAFYVLDLGLPGVDGVDVIQLLRRRSDAGVVVVSGRTGQQVLTDVLVAGADMHLVKPVTVEQVQLAVAAVHRRAARGAGTLPAWRLERAAGHLVAPDGALIVLSDIDMQVMDCFAAAAGETVTRETLRERLGRAPADEGDDGLNAIIYRLRRRIERATPLPVPLQSRSRVGYVFKAPIEGTATPPPVP
jgi:two-component system, OmpR family, response regulator